MEENVYGVEAEEIETPQESLLETEAETVEETPKEEETTEEAETLADGTPKEEKTVPYERFSEINEKNREMEETLQQTREELAEIRGTLQATQQPQQPEEAPVFETPEDLIKYNQNLTKQELDTREKALQDRFESQLEAQTKMQELTTKYPEVSKDPIFAEMVRNRISENPQKDIVEVAGDVKEYINSIKAEGRKTAEKELAQRGVIQGGVTGNQPLKESDEDKALKDAIMGSGRDDGSVF